MATASWNPFGVAITLTVTTGTPTRTSATQFKVPITAEFSAPGKTDYGMDVTVGNTTKTINEAGVKTTGKTLKFDATCTTTVSANGSTDVYVKFKNYNPWGDATAKAGKEKSVKVTINVPAWTSYTVSYNKNAGNDVVSNMPSNQTKWKSQSLTLSSNIPTRTGYKFQGWGKTASNTTVDYAAGAAYTTDDAITLYAIWKANTYTVSYNANGGSNAPANQTKTYGTDLPLSKTIPLRSKYNFKGWGTSATDTTVDYAAGATYKTDKNITLYAIWELAYVDPIISNLSIKRCDPITGLVTDDGTAALVNFGWTTCENVKSIKLSWVIDGITEIETIEATGTSGLVIDYKVGLNSEQGAAIGKFDPEVSYKIILTIVDEVGSISRTIPLNTPEFPIDVFNEGKGVAFGKAAELEGVADFGFEMRSSNGELITSPIELALDDDLDDLLTPGYYVIPNTTVTKTIKNKPLWHDDATVTMTANIQVTKAGNTGQIIQRFFACSITEQFIFQRVYDQSAWGEWVITSGCTTWQKLTLESGFAVYSTGADPKYRVNGNVVTVTGIVKPTAEVTSGTTGVKFAGVIPAKFRPAVDCQFICQGSGINRWVMSVDTDGYLYVSRYGTNAYVNIASGAWLPFTVTYSM